MQTERVIPFRVTQASTNQTAFDYARNFANATAAIDKAVADKSDLLALEELFVTGYDAGDDFQKTDNAEIGEFLRDVAQYAYAKDPNLILSIGHPWHVSLKDIPAIPELEDARRNNTLFNRINLPFNVQSFISQGRVLNMTAKKYLFNYERGYEKRYFAEWNDRDARDAGFPDGVIPLRIEGQNEPVLFGRPMLRVQGKQGEILLTHVICEEKWVATRFDDGDGSDRAYERDGVVPALARKHGKEGLVVIIPDASPPAALKGNKHIHLVELAARYAEAIVNTDGLGSSGSTFAQAGHRLIAQDGKLLSSGTRYSFARVAATSRTFFVTHTHSRASAANETALKHDFATPQYLKKALPVRAPGTWDDPANPALEMEETTRMACLWLFDYMRKNKINGIAEALSGGMDSAFNSVLAAAMVRLAMAELGVDGFCKEMGHLPYRQAILDAEKTGGVEAAYQTCMQHMLTAVYMGTDNSSEATRNAARMLIEGGEWQGQQVKGIGGKFLERNVQGLIDYYAAVYAVENTSALEEKHKAALLAELAAHFNLSPHTTAQPELTKKVEELKERYPELKGEILSAADPKHSIAYENIQARARQALINMLANVEGKMAIANPNLDEARNSYATYGGDLHGGSIGLNAFINKNKQIEIMRHLASHGLSGVGVFSSLLAVLGNEPSAELQPKDASGKVIQTDVQSLQRSFGEMDSISMRMLAERMGEHKERRLNPMEVFKACAADPLFSGQDFNRIHNKVRLSYSRWWMSQFKIHASAIAPTYGNNVDHQTSLRTPNISGQDLDQLNELGVRLLFARAKKEFGDAHPRWQAQDEAAWVKRAKRDEHFRGYFDYALRKYSKYGMLYDIEALYQQLRDSGLEAYFGPIDPKLRSLSETNPSKSRLDMDYV